MEIKTKKDTMKYACLDICNISSVYKYEYNGICIDTCQYGTISNDLDKCRCELEKCLICPPVALDKQLCTNVILIIIKKKMILII